MSNTITLNMDVVKNYHILINNKAGYASLARVGFLPLIAIFFRAFERKLRRMVERLPNQPFRIVKAQPCRLYQEEPGKSQRKPRCRWLLPGSNWGFVQGGYPSLCLLAPLEKRNINY